jgi:hypothetical protein
MEVVLDRFVAGPYVAHRFDEESTDVSLTLRVSRLDRGRDVRPVYPCASSLTAPLAGADVEYWFAAREYRGPRCEQSDAPGADVERYAFERICQLDERDEPRLVRLHDVCYFSAVDALEVLSGRRELTRLRRYEDLFEPMLEDARRHFAESVEKKTK